MTAETRPDSGCGKSLLEARGRRKQSCVCMWGVYVSGMCGVCVGLCVVYVVWGKCVCL